MQIHQRDPLQPRYADAKPGFPPTPGDFQDAEQLDFTDAEFDVVIAHSGLHHAQSPRRALLECAAFPGPR